VEEVICVLGVAEAAIEWRRPSDHFGCDIYKDGKYNGCLALVGE